MLFVISLPFLIQCSPALDLVHTPPRNNFDYSQFFDLADALRQEPGLVVRGYGRNVSVRSRRSLNADLLFVVNGMEVGNDYNAVNDQVIMDQIVSIRVGTNLTHRTITGKSNGGGMVEITTR